MPRSTNHRTSGLTESLSRLSEALGGARSSHEQGASPTAASANRERETGCSGATIGHVLVPLDGSRLAERAIPWAVAIAQGLSSHVTLVRVLETLAGHDTGAHRHDPVEWQIRRAEAHRELTRLDHELKAKGVTSAVKVLEGRAAEQIINFAKRHDIDLVVLSSHGEGGLSQWTLSGTALMIVTRAHCSVLVLPAYATEGRRPGEIEFRRILVPLDCSPRAECVLPLATALARAHGAELILAHVAPEPEMPRHLPPSGEDLALATQLTERNRAEGACYLNEVRARLVAQGLTVGVRLVASMRRAAAIRAMADDVDADLIMLSAHGRTGDAGERYGSVAARLVVESGRPIIVFQDIRAGIRDATGAEEAARGHPGH